jgi:glycosyltransferase 2 family protein
MEEEHPPAERPSRIDRFFRSRWINWLTYAAAAGALTYVLLNVRFSELAHGVSQMIWWPVILAVVLQIAPRALQAWRWGYLLRPLKVRLHHLLHAIYVATLMNGVLPVCPSDLVRGVLVARRAQAGTARVFTSQAVERVADGIALALVTWLAARDLKLPAALHTALLGFAGVIGIGIVIGVVLMVKHRHLHSFVTRRQPGGRAGRAFKGISLDILSGVKAVKAWTMPVSIAAGMGILMLQVVTMWLMLYAYRMDLSLFEAAALFGIITIGTLIPNAPGKIGSWQFFCILGLGLMGVPADHAAGFSMIAFAIWTLPSLLWGGVAMVLSPVSWAGLRAGRGTGNKPAGPDRPREAPVT